MHCLLYSVLFLLLLCVIAVVSDNSVTSSSLFTILAKGGKKIVIATLPFTAPLTLTLCSHACVSSGYLNVGGGGEFSHDTERKAPLQSRLAGYLMSLVIGSLWPLRIPALPLLMCAGTERERGGRRVGVTPTHQSHPPSIHPSLAPPLADSSS